MSLDITSRIDSLVSVVTVNGSRSSPNMQGLMLPTVIIINSIVSERKSSNVLRNTFHRLA